MRIASLVPSATEMLFALGLGDSVVGVTHECDFPPDAESRARLTRSVIPEGLPPGEVDAAVRELTGAGRALYELDEQTLARLDVDLIVTQALCAVCAVSYDDVRAVASRLPGTPSVISLDPETLSDVIADVMTLGEATASQDEAAELRAELERRIDAVAAAVAGSSRPRVAALEWLEPPFAAGHWVPEMVDLAGGVDVLGKPGRKSRTVAWEEVAEARPEIVVAMPCGLYVDEAHEQALAYREQLDSLRAERIVAVDAAASFSRPGPRLVEGLELLAHILHPSRVAAPEAMAWRPVGGVAVA
jgi:iron complex transport system substrate-binding protein